MSRPIPAGVIERLLANMAAAGRDIGEHTQLRPVSLYNDPVRYAREMERLFRGLPIVVAHSGQLPDPGDFVSHDKLGVPLIIARGKSGQVAAFHNICRHRASVVETAARGQRGSFMCPYHNWTYALDGALLHIPDEASFDKLDKSQLGLRPVTVAEKYGLIFVRLAPGPPIDVDAWLGRVAPELPLMRLAEHREFRTLATPLKCNWKVMMEGSLETYHFNFLHTRPAVRGDVHHLRRLRTASAFLPAQAQSAGKSGGWRRPAQVRPAELLHFS
jgi:phenylpropionate dioxygenase-like ring-hydroxylating dioxygenase large terminal subunit